MSTPVFATADALLAHLESLATVRSEELESLSELDHGLQCASWCLRWAPDDVELQVAGLVHDLAHPWDEPGQPRHALMGADAVRGLLGTRVADLIAGHVPAKRYLVTTDVSYRGRLSPDSVRTLAEQGGEMDAAEVAWFESLPDHEAMLVLRRADDAAKVPGAVVPGLETWIDPVRTLAAGR